MTARSSGIAVFCKSIQFENGPHTRRNDIKTNGLIEAKKKWKKNSRQNDKSPWLKLAWIKLIKENS